MKKLFMAITMLAMTLTASAQFEAGTWYGNASVSGLNLSYNETTKFKCDFDVQAGYFLGDCLAITAKGGVNSASDYTDLYFGVGARYYMIQNGVYLGVNATMKQLDTETHNDFMPGIEVGYAYYINHYVTIEPALYYDISLKNNSKYSTFGLKIGVGVYF